MFFDLKSAIETTFSTLIWVIGMIWRVLMGLASLIAELASLIMIDVIFFEILYINNNIRGVLININK